MNISNYSTDKNSTNYPHTRAVLIQEARYQYVPVNPNLDSEQQARLRQAYELAQSPELKQQTPGQQPQAQAPQQQARGQQPQAQAPQQQARGQRPLNHRATALDSTQLQAPQQQADSKTTSSSTTAANKGASKCESSR